MSEKPLIGFDPEIAALLCERVTQGETIAAICRDAGMPSRTTIWRWSVSNQEFATQLDRAIELRADHWAEQTLEIADAGEDSHRDRLRVDTRKWLAQKLYRKRYGDHKEIEHKGKIENLQPVLNVTIGGDKSGLAPEARSGAEDES